mmetsp:Transcript_39530/g.86265  ORF Transcript_39530/g.86265 Transcript_39530/m.86265 type:complete len:85 (+) Transcript_39530:85-339(+)
MTDAATGGAQKGKGKGERRLPHTIPCTFFGSATGCKHGAKCRFSHEDKSKVKLCKFIDDISKCPHQDKCFFRHVKMAADSQPAS